VVTGSNIRLINNILIINHLAYFIKELISLVIGHLLDLLMKFFLFHLLLNFLISCIDEVFRKVEVLLINLVLILDQIFRCYSF
jgi:hypothetical protein